AVSSLRQLSGGPWSDHRRLKHYRPTRPFKDVDYFLGAIIAFTIGERFVRKRSILLGTTIMSVGTILQAGSFSLPRMFVGRVVLGVGNRINTATASIWQTETSPPWWAGKLVMLEMVMNIAGFALVNWINYGLPAYHSGVVRLPEVCRLHCSSFLSSFCLLPFHGFPSLQDGSCRTAMKSRPSSIHYERQNSIGRSQLIFNWKKNIAPKTMRRLPLGAGTQFMQQLQGINIMSYNLPTVLIDAFGLSNRMPRLLTACNSVSYFVFTCASAPLVERWGRRGLMLLSTAGQFLAFLIITILLRYTDGNEKVAEGSIVFFFLLYIAFGLGMLGIPWLYPTEISSLPMRTKSAAVATATNWICNFVIVEITPIGNQNIGWRFWIVWSVLSAAFISVIYFFYPETANCSLEDLNIYYRSNPSPIVTKDLDAVCVQRPMKYIQHEEEEIMKNAKSTGVNQDKAHAEHAE
ncbi:hypothetical protein N7532_001551, partial [Penicillium argentinense]